MIRTYEDLWRTNDFAVPPVMTCRQFLTAPHGVRNRCRARHNGNIVAAVESAYDDQDWILYYADGTRVFVRFNTILDLEALTFSNVVVIADGFEAMRQRLVAQQPAPPMPK